VEVIVRDKAGQSWKFLGDAPTAVVGSLNAAMQKSKILHERRPVETAVVSSRKNQEHNGRPTASLKMEVFAQSLRVGACGQKVLYTYLMTTKAPADPILKRRTAALDETYGNRLDRVVLFGSHARGEARPDSDYDIAVFLKDRDSFRSNFLALAQDFISQRPFALCCQ
jgi:predicted nucleotidyltransferase